MQTMHVQQSFIAVNAIHDLMSSKAFLNHTGRNVPVICELLSYQTTQIQALKKHQD